MKPLISLSLATLLAIGSTAPASAGQLLQHGSLGGPCELEAGVASPPVQGEVIVAIIHDIDHQQGLLELDTEFGLLQIQAAPEEIQGLRIGDKLLVQIVGEGPTHQLLRDPIIT
jgi:hypothetical protein